ncbi:hypothetical protein MPSEU_001091700 [Mayamaea pseudoterrestris]|nr:hypothetical protein MPSEU_001091700 [Mayamaea pseudoterrestris]
MMQECKNCEPQLASLHLHFVCTNFIIMTAVTLYVSRYKSLSGMTDPNCAHAVQLTLWRECDSAVNSSTQSLRCYSFIDHPAAYTHLQALLQQADFDVSCIHVAAEKQVKQRALGALEQVLQQILVTQSQDNDENNDSMQAIDGPPALDVTIRFHETLPKSKCNLSQTLAHRLSRQAALSVGAHSDLSSLLHSSETTHLSTSLEFYFSATQTEQSSLALEIDVGKLPSFLSLDKTACEAIHLWPPSHIADQVGAFSSASNASLFGLLRQPLQTHVGKLRLATWLQQPLVQLEQILERQEAVAWLLQRNIARDALKQEGLAGFAAIDLDGLAKQLEMYTSIDDEIDSDAASSVHDGSVNDIGASMPLGPTTKALQAMYKLWLVASQRVPLLRDRLQVALSDDPSTLHHSHNDETAVPPSLLVTLLHGLEQCEQDLVLASQLAEDVVDLDAAPREYRLRPGYKPELEQVYDELNELETQVQECLEQMNETWANISGKRNAVKLDRNSNDGEFQFRLADANDLKLLEATTQIRVQVSRILKNGVYFTTKELRGLASRKQDLKNEYDKYQRQLAMQAMQAAASYVDVLSHASQLVATLDVIVGFSHIAAYSNYVRPELTDNEDDGTGIVLKAARHPCVELQDGVDFIPNDIRLVYGEQSFLLITGPNMGGKSVYIRSLGAIVALAQVGAYVPCASAKMNICHDILARVGAGDLQERGISTFMAEMLESSSILRRATKRSLIMIDELGRGTSTFDGYGLARAISEYIVDTIGCMTVFTTHFHELTALEDCKHVVKNYHVTAKKGDHGLTFLYEVKPGPCLESFGIQVAKMANVPSVVIEDAKIKAKELENFQYTKKRQSSESSPSSVVNSGYAVDDHDQAESVAADTAFVKRLRQINLKDLLSREYASEDEKKAAVMSALEAALSHGLFARCSTVVFNPLYNP